MAPHVTLLAHLLVLAALAGVVPAPAGADPAQSAPASVQDPEFTAGVKAIEQGNFAAAIPLLERVVARDASNPDAYNSLAYAIRRAGDPARAIPIYQKALALDPKHRGAHEYIGEAYLVLDDVGKAKEHLAALDRLCLLPCEQHRDLKKAVEAYEKSGGKNKPQAAK